MKVPARLVTAAAIALMSAGCSAVNPITTQQAYDASDGVSAQVGDVRALNLLVVAEAEGSPAVLTGSLHNPTDEDVTVSISLDGETGGDVVVPASATVKLGGENEEAHVTGTAAVQPGLLQEVTFVTGEVGAVTAQAPVVDGTLPEYQAELDGLS